MAVTRRAAAALFLIAASVAGGCSSEPAGAGRTGGAPVTIDGSSTLGPMLEVARDLFKSQQPGIVVQVATSGTSNGFRRLLAEDKSQRIDVCKASRPIAPEEVERAGQLGIAFIELPVALDGIAVVVHPRNSFCDDLTHEELRRIWAPESTINNWRDVRPGFPDLALKLFGPGPQSGTFDVFTTLVVGRSRQSRRDYIASESDNVLVVGVSNEPGALGYFGFSYFEENRDKLKELGVAWDGGKPIRPTAETIRDGSYPLARPCLLYVGMEAAGREEVATFLRFFLKEAPAIVEHRKVRSVALSPALYRAAERRLADRQAGTAFKTPQSSTTALSALYLGDGSE